MRFGRRIGWYALVRAAKPAVVVETGVDKGLGAVLLTAALLRNGREGRPGRYFGADINPKAGYLLSGEYRAVGTILYGDSVETLRRFGERIDLFINDSLHTEEYEAREYEAVAGKLGERAIVIGDNARETGALLDFAERTGRAFLYYQERPTRHWFWGDGLGFAFAADTGTGGPRDQTPGRCRA